MTVGFYTLGCKVNQYDTQAVKEILLQGGYTEADFSHADVCIVNTCTVTAVADKKSRQAIRRAVERGAVVVACGCMAQTERDKLLELGVSAVIGNGELKSIAGILDKILGSPGKKLVLAQDIRAAGDFEETGISQSHEKTRAYLKVQEGCDNFCAYCAIPIARGRSRSRRFEDAADEARRLCDSGVREIVVTGIRTDDYMWEGLGLIDLIEAVAGAAPESRLRLGSLHPGCFTSAFLSRAASVPNLCPHFHVSLQSGSAIVLKRMNREYTPDDYFHCLEAIRRYFDDPALTTDIIAGFPGETDEEHAKTVEFVKRCGFSRLHVFPYSRREGTAAASMPGQVNAKVKAARASELIAVGRELESAYARRFIGKPVSVLLEEPSAVDGFMEGYTERYLRARAVGGINELITITPARLDNGVLDAG